MSFDDRVPIDLDLTPLVEGGEGVSKKESFCKAKLCSNGCVPAAGVGRRASYSLKEGPRGQDDSP